MTQDQLPHIERPETLQEFTQDAAESIRRDDAALAFQILQTLRGLIDRQPNFSSVQPQLYRAYQALIIQLRWGALEMLEEPEILELFQQHATVALALPDYSLWEHLKCKLVGLMSAESRNALKHNVHEALRENTELLTPETKITKDGVEQPGTIQNWLMDAQINLGTQPLEMVKISEYLVNTLNTKALTDDTRRRLGGLLAFIEELKRPSDTPEGYEGEIPYDDPENPGVIVKGKFQRQREELDQAERDLQKYQAIIDRALASESPSPAPQPPASVRPAPIAHPAPATPSASSASTLTGILRQSEADTAAWQKEEEKLLVSLGRGEISLSRTLEAALAQRQEATAVAALFILARTQELLNHIRRDNAFANWLTAKYGAPAKRQISQQPNDPALTALWLRWSLEERLRLPEDRSARLAAQLANVLGRRYVRLAYLDAPSKKFRWTPVSVSPQGLRLGNFE